MYGCTKITDNGVLHLLSNLKFNLSRCYEITYDRLLHLSKLTNLIGTLNLIEVDVII